MGGQPSQAMPAFSPFSVKAVIWQTPVSPSPSMALKHRGAIVNTMAYINITKCQ